MKLKGNLNLDFLFQPLIIPNHLKMSHMNDNAFFLVQYKNEIKERVTTNIRSLFSQTENRYCSQICYDI